MKIIIVGTHQTGSTRLYNLIRTIYKKKNINFIAGWNLNPNNFEDNSNIISKVHSYNIDNLQKFDYIIMPIRNILDSCISRNKRFGVNFKKSCYSNIDLFYKFEKHCNFIFKYEEYSINLINKLCIDLNINLNTIEIIEIMKEVNDLFNDTQIPDKDDNNNEFYKNTLLSKHHNTSNGQINKFINKMNINEIKLLLDDKKILDFMKYCNYI